MLVGRQLCLAALLGMLGPAAAHGSTLDLFGYGARGVGMGGAVTATATGHEAIYYNPAGLAFDRAPSFAIGYQRGDFLLDIGGSRREAEAAPALILGFAVPVPLGGPLKDRIGLGLGFVLPQTTILNAGLPRPGEEHFVLVANRAQTVSIQGALGVRILDGLALGIGFLALARLEGNIDVAPNARGTIGATVGDQLLADFSFVAGLMARPLPELSLGLSYREASVASFDLPITTDLGSSFPIPIPPLDVRGTAQFDPRQVWLEAAWRPRDTLLLAAAGGWKQWSAFPTPVVFTAVPAEAPAQRPPGFHDTFLLRLGAEARVPVGSAEILPRLGYVYEPSPAPEQTGLNGLLDNDRHILSAGAGLRAGALRLDLAVQWQILPERSSTKDPVQVAAESPLFADPNAPARTLRHGGHILFWVLELGMGF